ncbi:MAG: dihydroorotase [Parcubacteria group bacterium]|nr:dihydroorotase [Parcubacteria group bacterium]
MPNIRTQDDPFEDEMPSPPAWNASTMELYRREIESLLAHIMYVPARETELQLLMSIALLDETKPEHIDDAVQAGAIIAKAYPKNPDDEDEKEPSLLNGPAGEMTTNSEYGVSDFRAPQLQPTLQAMSDTGLVLSIHGEQPGAFCMDREKEFLTTLVWLHEQYPNLKIVLEHITTKAALDCVRSLGENVAATVTVHHLLLTLDDVIGGKINPHNFCKPIAKRHEDQEALLGAVLEGFPRLFLGTDSAPHLREKKECADGCAGVFSAPVAMQVLCQLFQECDALDRLEPFVSEFGARFYGLPLNEDTITLVNEPWEVPLQCSGVVPYMAGRTLNWQVAGVEVDRW